MYGIGDYINGRWRYLASKSTPETFWSTADRESAWTFPSVKAARDWSESIPGGRCDVLAARFPYVVSLVGDDVQPLDDPLDDLDSRTFTPEQARLAEQDSRAEQGVKLIRARPARDGGAGLFDRAE